MNEAKVKFLAARCAEDWGVARDRELAQGLAESRGTREADAKRAIMSLYVDTALIVRRAEDAMRVALGPSDSAIFNRDCLAVGRELAVLELVIDHLVGAYSDHPDFKQEWAPAGA